MIRAFAVTRTFWRLSWRDRLLLVEAALWLAAAAVVVAVLPFRTIGRLATRNVRTPEPPPDLQKAAIRRVRWSVEACARRVPWRAACFEQGLAAHFMLRRRGIASVLYYGATPDAERGLSAHVWVKAGNSGVVGHKIANQFAILTTFPQDSLPNQGVHGIREPS
jgi:hypothetical protein